MQSNVTQADLLYKRKPKTAGDLSLSDMPERFVLGECSGGSADVASELLEGSPVEGGSMLEYSLTLSSDNQSYEIIPFCYVTPIQSNGSIIALDRTDPDSGDFMWRSGYTGVFPRLSQSEGFDVLKCHGYSVQGDNAELVFFDYETYWMFNVTAGEDVTNAFVGFCDREIKLASEMLSRLVVLQGDGGGMGGGGSTSASETSASMESTSSYSSEYTWMVGQVPYFRQEGPTCGLYSLKQVFWWWGTKYQGHYVEVADIACALGHLYGPHYLDELHDAFVDFMGHGKWHNLDSTWGSSNIEIEKSWLMSWTPPICCIRAPGTGWGLWANHYVTLVGWNDNWRGGCWILHDTGGHIEDHGFDIYVTYDEFDDWWDKYWTAFATRGSVSAVPGDCWYANPEVEIRGLPTETQIEMELPKDDEPIPLVIELNNAHGDVGLREARAHGVSVRLENARFVSADSFFFEGGYQGYDTAGNEVSLEAAEIIEFYTPRWYYGMETPRGRFRIRPSTMHGDAAQVTLHYRGWITDEDDAVFDDPITVDDDRHELLNTSLAEYRIVRDPVDIWNDRDNFLDYPVHSVSFTVFDDDTTGPSIEWHGVPVHILDNYPGDFTINVEVTDESGVGSVDYLVQLPHPEEAPIKAGWYRPRGGWGEHIVPVGDNEYSLSLPRSIWAKPESWLSTWGDYPNPFPVRVYFLALAADNDNDARFDEAETMRARVCGTISDDDTLAPSFSNSLIEYVEDTEVFRIKIDVADTSGIYTVQFRYKFQEDSWSSWYTYTDSLGDTYWYDIPYETWNPHSGQTISWQAHAEDNDDDLIIPEDSPLTWNGDRTSGESQEYSATVGIPVLHVTAESPVNICVTDPNGFQVGYDPETGPVNQIPGAKYSGPGTEPQEITIPNPVVGTYVIDAFGTDIGTYTITMESFALDGSLIDSQVWAGTAEPGEQYTQNVQLEPDGAIADITPPTTEISLVGTLGLNSWYTSDVTVALTPTDDMSGVAITEYSFDSVSWTTYTGPFDIDTEETTIIYYNSTDNAGNVEETKSAPVEIDKTPPAISGETTTSPNPYGWYNTDVVVHFTATDDISGVAYITPDQTLTAEGADQSVVGTAIDKAGNTASYTVNGINIDKTPPTITGSPTTLPNENGWYNNDVVVHFTASDSLSGILTVTPDQTISTEGADQAVTGSATDKAGNSASYTVTGINIDRTPPTTSLEIGDPKFGTNPIYVSTVTSFTLSATNGLSGVDCTKYKIDSGTWITYSAPFTPPGIGSYTLNYHSVDRAGNIEDIYSIELIVNATALACNGDTAGQYSDPVTVKATLIDMATQQPISSKSIMFTVGSQSATSATDSQGVAEASILLDQPAGTYTVYAGFAGDANYLGSSDSQPFTIQKEDATVDYTGDTVVSATTRTVHLRATVFDSPDGSCGDLTKMQVTFRIYTAPIDLDNPVDVVGPISVTLTDMPGVGVAIAEIPNLPENGYIIIVSIDQDDNDYFRGPTSDPIPLTVYEPTGEFVTGGGWIWDPTGSKGSFGFNAKYTNVGRPKGHSIYVYRENGWDYIVKSNAWIGLAIEDVHAYFEAKCVVQKYNPETGALVWDEGNYKFRVDVWDNDSDGGVDFYQIRVLDKNGVQFHEAGFHPLGELQGGSIVIHSRREPKE